MKIGGGDGKWELGADRNMWQRLGDYPKAIVGRNPSGARERQEGGIHLWNEEKGVEGEKNPHATVYPSFPSRRLQNRQPNRWANFFAVQFNEASLNSLPGAADRSRSMDGRRAARGLGGKRLEGMMAERGRGTPHRRRFVNRPLATLQCGRKVRERRFHWPARSRPYA